MLRTVTSLLAFVVAGSAWAGPKENLHAAFAKFLAAKTFRATVTDVKNGEQLSQMEFVAPNRYHMHNAKAGMDTVIVGDDAWMDMHGQLTKMPIPVGKIVNQYRNEKSLSQFESADVTDLGADSVGGEPAHAYHYTLTEPTHADVKVWIDDKTGLPLQMESQGNFMGHASTTRIHYSNFDDPTIQIAAP